MDILTSICYELPTLTSRVGKVETAVGKIPSIQEALDKLHADQKLTHGRLTDHQTQIRSLDEDGAVLKACLSKVQASADSLRTELDALRTEQSQIATQHSEEIARLQEENRSLREAIEALQKQVAEVESKHEEAKVQHEEHNNSQNAQGKDLQGVKVSQTKVGEGEAKEPIDVPEAEKVKDDGHAPQEVKPVTSLSEEEKDQLEMLVRRLADGKKQNQELREEHVKLRRILKEWQKNIRELRGEDAQTDQEEKEEIPLPSSTTDPDLDVTDVASLEAACQKVEAENESLVAQISKMNGDIGKADNTINELIQ